MVRSLGEYFELDKKAHLAKEYALEHPIMTVFWIVTMAMCGVPIICFFTFVFASVLFSIAGFVLIEGKFMLVLQSVLQKQTKLSIYF